jgi:hypothetical protein
MTAGSPTIDWPNCSRTQLLEQCLHELLKIANQEAER